LVILYCYFRKVSATDDGAEDLRKKLVEAEEENARLKAVNAKHEDDLRFLGEHSALMKCEASAASKAKDRAKVELATMSKELEGMRAMHSALQESHIALQAEHTQL
jgi:hypothetical protein